MSFTLTATMKSHADGEIHAHTYYEIEPIPSTTVDSSGKVVRSGGKRVKTDGQGKFAVTLASGEGLYYTVRRSFGPTPFDFTFKAPSASGGTVDLSDLAQIVTPPLGGGGGGGGRGISTILNDPDDMSKIIITYTDGSTATLTLPPGTGAVDSVNGQTGVVVITASDVGAKPSNYVPAWVDVTEKPPTFPPSAHTHVISNVTGLQAALDGKQPSGSYALTGHTHVISNVTGLQAALDGKQPSGSYATGIQGAKADTAVQPNLPVQLEDSSQYFTAINIPDDGTPTSGWPDRLAFYFEDGTPGGRRTGYFNEYGELRARPARTSTVGFRAFSHFMADSSQEYFQIVNDGLDSVMFAVNKDYINLYAPLRHAPTDQPLANVIVLDEGEPVPVGTPEGTVVVIRPL